MNPNGTREALWRQDESLRGLGERLAAAQGGVRVVSFDFFDTLICRLCAEPSDLFIELGRRLAAQDMLLLPLTPEEFRGVREAADERAREKAVKAQRSYEVRLADIHTELAQVVRDPAASCKLEFELERLVCFFNPAVASLVEHAHALGYRTAILSDTYFTAAQLGQLLADHGFSPAVFGAILTSNECGRAKWSGQLYHDLFRHFDIHPSELIHIGDNFKADVTNARHFGVEAIHYYRTNPQLDGIFKSEQNLRGAAVQRAAALDSLRVMTARQAIDEKDAFRDGAMTFGPVLSRFADWAVQRYAAAGVRKVFALMREGELLGELLRRSAQAAQINLDVVPCFVSRMSTALPALSELTPYSAIGLLEGGAAPTAEIVLEILGVHAAARKSLPSELLTKRLATPESILGFLRLLFSLPKLRQDLDERHKESFALAFEYLATLAGNENKIGVIDVGWSGSIQRNLSRILRRGGRDIQTVGCYLACRRRAGRLSLDGDVAHAYANSDWDGFSILAEVAITACVGSTDHYRRDAKGVATPVLGAYDISPGERQLKERLRDGILAFQSRWLAICAEKTFSPEMLKDLDVAAAAILDRLQEYPTKPEADRLGSLRHDENYFSKRYSAPLCDDVSPSRLRKSGIQQVYHSAKCYWPQGVVARDNARLVAALRGDWSDPLTLGRLGVTHGVTPENAPLTDEETASLGDLLSGLRPTQVILCSPISEAIEELFLFLWKNKRTDTRLDGKNPRIIVPAPKTDFNARPEFAQHCAFLSEELNGAKLHSVRSRLASDGNSALVLPGEMSPSVARWFLNGLAPFLGEKGVVLAACGRSDRNVPEEAPLAAPLEQWCAELGTDLGYKQWDAPAAAEGPLCNWIAYARALNEVMWNRQWTFRPGDNLILQ